MNSLARDIAIAKAEALCDESSPFKLAVKLRWYILDTNTYTYTVHITLCLRNQ